MKAYDECTHTQEESAWIRGGVEDFFVLAVQNLKFCWFDVQGCTTT